MRSILQLKAEKQVQFRTVDQVFFSIKQDIIGVKTVRIDLHNLTSPHKSFATRIMKADEIANLKR